jgi:hypothetical protein
VDAQCCRVALRLGRHARGELAVRGVLGGADVGVRRVAEHVDVEVFRLAGRDERIDRRCEPAEHRRHVLVADRHDDRRAHRRVERAHRLCREPARERAGAAEEKDAGAHDRGPEARRDPGEEDAEEDEETALGESRAVLRQHVGHRLGAEASAEDDEDEQEHAAQRQRALVVGAARRQDRCGAEQAPERPRHRRSCPRARRHRATCKRRMRGRLGQGFSASGGTM